MSKLLYPLILATMVAACHPAPIAPAAPITKSYDSYNPTATEHVRAMLSKTTTVTMVHSGSAYALTASETATLLALLEGVQSSTLGCAPADCFHLNLQDSDGKWLMSLPMQNTPEGIVLLYLNLQGNNAGAPLQDWWKSVSSRLGL